MKTFLGRLLLLGVLLLGGAAAWAQDDTIPREAAINAARQLLGTRPLRWTFERFFETRDSSLGCPSAPKGDLGRPVIPYRFVLSYPSGEYVVWASSDGTVVVLCDEKFAAAGLPAATVAPPATPVVAEGACVLSPLGAFANVREVPSIEGRQVGQIFSGQFFPVIAINSNPSDVWYFTTGGWVSRQAANVTGNCAALPIDDTRTGTGAGLTAPTTNVDLARALQEYACPPDFAGYMPPRIRVGDKTAKIGGGTIPNTLRSQPIANDAIGVRLGVIQPNRVLDRVANGPACSGGIVWWYVEIDGNVGWTAESDFARSDYFIEPMPGFEVVTLPRGTDYTPVRLNQRTDSAGAVDDIAFSANSRYLYVGSRVGSQLAGMTHALVEYDLASNAPTDRGVGVPAEIARVQVVADGTVFVSDRAGNVVVADVAMNVKQQLTGLFAVNESAGRNVASSDGRFVAHLGCQPNGLSDRGFCTASTLTLRSVATSAVIWSVNLPRDVLVDRLYFAPDDSGIVAFGFDAVFLFDRATGMQLSRFGTGVFASGMLDIAFHPSTGEVLTSTCKNALATGGCTQGEITLWNPLSGQVLGIVLTNANAPTSLLYSPDGTLIFVGDADGKILVRYGATGELARELVLPADSFGVPQAVYRMAISPDGTKLAVVSSRTFDVYLFDITKLYKE